LPSSTLPAVVNRNSSIFRYPLDEKSVILVYYRFNIEFMRFGLLFEEFEMFEEFRVSISASLFLC
jgi:hypothetical protein